MFNKTSKNYIFNPSIGLLPFLVYFFLYNFTNLVNDSLIVSLFFAIILQVVLKLFLRMPRNELILFISFISLALTLLIWFALHKIIIWDQAYLILPEIIMVSILMIVRLIKPYIKIQFTEKGDISTEKYINDVFGISILIQYFFTLHVFIILIYKYLKDNEILSENNDSLFYIWLPVTGIIILFIYETIKTITIAKKLAMEEWLPIVNEKGEVKGKIAKSETLILKNAHLHPVIRIVLICNGKIYLQERNPKDILDPCLLDHPFEKYLQFNQQIDTAAKSAVKEKLEYELPLNFILKYTLKKEKTKRLIFLFVARMEEEQQIEGHPNLWGKFWTTKQIDADLGEISKFSECFQSEYEYLKNTILIADKINKKTTGN